ncbi:MAG: sigma-70 family RNA polymerase sigma factor [Pyrinomonadaceae bacterium]|nr:sigma-70 family RNA polymerase sigma factor [Pyrinomonadaceae bacterium]
MREQMKPANITALLHQWKNGRQEAFDELFPFVYNELRRRASAYLRSERGGHTLQTTALVHEAYLKLSGKSEVEFEDRDHFFAIAATAMRRILVDHARSKKREKRGGSENSVSLDDAAGAAAAERSIDLIALDDALTRLSSFDQRQAAVVEMKYFGGMTNDETANALGISNATVRRDWDLAKAWLFQQLSN